MRGEKYEDLKKRCEGQRKKIAKLEQLLTDRRVTLLEIIGPDSRERTLPGLLRTASIYCISESFAQELLRRADLAQAGLDGIEADRKRHEEAA